MSGRGLGGIAANDSCLIFGDRDITDFLDVFYCLDLKTGRQIWKVEYPAIGKLDYGNTPRATPVIYDDRVFLAGAFGNIRCVAITSGKTIWQKSLKLDFGILKDFDWGYCSTPLLVEGKLIVNPGSTTASVVALDAETGKVVWKTAGGKIGHSSFIAGEFGGVKQIVGYDADSLGGWDINSGKRLWKVKPEFEGDFNVPTPIVFQQQLLVTTENNGTRLYRFEDDGTLHPQPVAINKKLNPDMSTPVVVGGKLFCVHKVMTCLSVNEGLKDQWKLRDESLSDYAAIIASQNRLLVVGNGELLLFDATSPQARIVSRLRVFEEKTELYSHPALVGTRLIIRGEKGLKCIDLAGN